MINNGSKTLILGPHNEKTPTSKTIYKKLDRTSRGSKIDIGTWRILRTNKSFT
jgi:hypothetical protein